MPSQEGSQQSVVLETPIASSSPLLSQMTPSTHQDRDRPIIRLIPPPPFSSTAAHSFAPSSSTSASTMPTPVDPMSAISLAAQPHSPSIEA
ncbi:uncharacterized protein H6S33_000747 [Morchella sextelata]|uniref:uncharacterized protein n=1 Tax=Morchella sextelata TaxID=1174677 RepID=UPI001D05C099|nr:uncharacterized protein H6S33_000747 [Morchella sextelata]KAH0615111.1 hypothetical protein H6S33_000747 [Morchella sextelata]